MTVCRTFKLSHDALSTLRFLAINLFLIVFALHIRQNLYQLIMSEEDVRFVRPHFRSVLARHLYERIQTDQNLKNLDISKLYGCDLSKIIEEVSSKFVTLELDEATQKFIDNCFEKSDWFFTQIWHTIAKSVLSWFMNQTSINGLLHRGSMFVFSNKQFKTLLGKSGDWSGDAMLDLGAGDGTATSQMSPLFKEVHVTEVSHRMRHNLSSRGYTVLDVESWQDYVNQYDVVTCLNLLDRCDKPKSIMESIKNVLKPGGYLIVAIVLPFKPYVEVGGNDHRPFEHIPVSGTTFEEQVESVVQVLFQPLGYELVRWTKLPYFCEGDLDQAFYWLDDAVFVLRVAGSV